MRALKEIACLFLIIIVGFGSALSSLWFGYYLMELFKHPLSQIWIGLLTIFTALFCSCVMCIMAKDYMENHP